METLNSSQLLGKVKDHATQILSKLPKSLVYHNVEHTTQVVEAAKALFKLSDEVNGERAVVTTKPTIAKVCKDKMV